MTMTRSGKASVKVGITGNGVAARLHKPVLSSWPGIQVVSVRLPDHFDPLEEAISDEQAKEVLGSLDLLIIGTPVFKHLDHLRSASRYECEILCEKPVGSCIGALMRAAKTFAPIEHRISVNYQLRFLRQVDQLRNAIRQDNAREVTIDYKSGARATRRLPDWCYDPSRGGGVVYSVLPHVIDLINYVGLDLPIVRWATYDPEVQPCESNEIAQPIPMNHIRVDTVTSRGAKVLIDIDVAHDCDRFAVRVLSDNQDITFDIISGKVHRDRPNESKLSYPIGRLSSGSFIGIWRDGFSNLFNAWLSKLQNNDSNEKLGLPGLKDAIEVHEKISRILNADLSRIRR